MQWRLAVVRSNVDISSGRDQLSRQFRVRLPWSYMERPLPKNSTYFGVDNLSCWLVEWQIEHVFSWFMFQLAANMQPALQVLLFYCCLPGISRCVDLSFKRWIIDEKISFLFIALSNCMIETLGLSQVDWWGTSVLRNETLLLWITHACIWNEVMISL